MGRDSGGAVRNCTKKKLLSSSGERRIQRAKRSIVLDVFLTRGPTWKHIREMRERWGIEAQTQVSPPYQDAEYTPQSLRSRPEEEFGEQAERWSAMFHEWRNDLAALYEAVVPAEARDSDYHTSFGWSVFLSMCVLFDPPETQLVDFAERFGWAGSNIIPRGDRTMNGPPIVWRKEHNELEATWMEFYEGLLGALLEKYVHPQGVTTEEAMRAVREQNPEICERWRQRLHRNESSPFIDVQPYHTSEDIDSAFQVLSDRHDASSRTSRGTAPPGRACRWPAWTSTAASRRKGETAKQTPKWRSSEGTLGGIFPRGTWRCWPTLSGARRGFCLTGDTLVAAEDIERSYKRRYPGEVITIQTARGHKLTGTPNHPVLTPHGWVALGQVRKGSHVIIRAYRKSVVAADGCLG